METEKTPIPFDELVSKQVEDTSFLNRKMRHKLISHISKFTIVGSLILTISIILFNIYQNNNNTATIIKEPPPTNAPVATLYSPLIYTEVFQIKDYKIHINYVKSTPITFTGMAYLDNTMIFNTSLKKEDIHTLTSFKKLFLAPNRSNFDEFSQEILSL